jgi:hypothetical protein
MMLGSGISHAEDDTDGVEKPRSPPPQEYQPDEYDSPAPPPIPRLHPPPHVLELKTGVFL